MALPNHTPLHYKIWHYTYLTICGLVFFFLIAPLFVILPLSLRGYITASVLTFAHTIGEFGVVLMVGGNIPGETRLVSIAIYEEVETLNYAQAHLLSGILVAFSFIVLLLVYSTNRRAAMRVL